MNKKNSVFNGLIIDNTVLAEFMVISPVIVCGNTVMNALAIIYVFSLITFVSVLVGSFVSKKLPYGFKIVIYVLIASLVYIPVKMTAEEFFPDVIQRTGIYFMLAAVNSLITVQAEAKFYRMPKANMIISLISHILGFDVVMLIISVVRELLAYGTLCERIVDAKILISGLATPFGGFIVLGLMCGLYRSICSSLEHKDRVLRGDEDVSGS